MPQPLSERTASFTDSVIRRMTRVSLKYGAVNLSQGFPDFEPPQAILERLAQVAREGPHQYSVTWGAQNFREALARKQSRYMGRTIDPDKEIVATCGSTEAMMCAMMTAANPGDKVIVFSPFYENYGADTILSGAEPIYVPLHPPAFTFDVDELEAAFRQRPKALVLCNPSNPCGRVFTREELLTIAEMATRYDTYVITDEVYEHIVYAPHRHTYFATLPGMWNRTLSCSSLSKTYSITGWRLGYIIAPEEIIDRAKKVHDFLTVGCAAPLQEAVIPGLEFGQDYYDDLLVQHPIELGQPFGDVLVHCGFADAEFLCGGADRGPVFDDVLSQPFGPLLHVTLQNTTLPASCCSILCGEKKGYARTGAEGREPLLSLDEKGPVRVFRTGPRGIIFSASGSSPAGSGPR